MMRLVQQHGQALEPHDAAAQWLLRSEVAGLSPVEEAELQAWIDADPSHDAAWEAVLLATRTVAENSADPRLMAMRAAALTERAQPRRRNVRAVAAAWAGLAMVGVATIWASVPGRLVTQGSAGSPATTASSRAGDPRTATYRTAVGERAAISLPDGSVATLDTDSAVQVAYTERERGVRLLYGQALLDVAKHKPTPFQVYAAGHRITAVGTRFDVRLAGAAASPRLKVALLEGVIKVTKMGAGPASFPGPSVTMAAGEVLEARGGAPLRVAHADVEALASWRSGMLTFDDAPLGAAVAEMNRYTTRPITIADAKLADLRVSGVFKSGDADRFAEDVAEALPVRVNRRADGGPALVRANLALGGG